MTLLNTNLWEIAAFAVLVAALLVVVLWLVLRKRPTPEELERARRQFLARTGRLVDGMLLDICEVEGKDGRFLSLLLYSYRIGGVEYESSQDITAMRSVVDAEQVQAGFPCSVRYQPGNHPNSIVVAEEWSGLRTGMPVCPACKDPEPVDQRHLRPNQAERSS
jgi:hypothetical protein